MVDASDMYYIDCHSGVVQTTSNAPFVSLNKKRVTQCLVLVGSRNGYQRDVNISIDYQINT